MGMVVGLEIGPGSEARVFWPWESQLDIKPGVKCILAGLNEHFLQQ